MNAPGDGPFTSDVAISIPNPTETAATEAVDALEDDIVPSEDGVGLQISVQIVLNEASCTQVNHVVSIVPQSELHPSPLTVLPSSQASLIVVTPFPHNSTHDGGDAISSPTYPFGQLTVTLISLPPRMLRL